jgi:hypothetical protein
MSSGSDKTFPRLLWNDGITSLALVKATYRVGFMFTIVCVTLTKEGNRLFVDALGAERTKNMQEVFQLLLCYWKWLHKSSYWELNDREARAMVRTSIRKMLERLSTLWPRTKGQGWELAKFHEQLHVPDDIYRHGPPSSTNTHVTEHQHVHVKAAAARTQGNRETLDKQLGQRIYEAAVIDAAYNGMTHHFGESAANGTLPDVSFELFVPQTASSITLELFYECYKTSQEQEKPQKYWSPLDYDIHKVQPHFFPMEGFKALHDAWRAGQLPGRKPDPTCTDELVTAEFKCFSEIKWKGHMFRASTSYKQKNAWFDWVVIRYQTENHTKKKKHTHPIEIGYPDDEYERSKHSYAPGRLLGFIVDRSSDMFSNDIYALLQMCKFTSSKSSVFTTQWEDAVAYKTGSRTMIPYYEVVSVKEQFVRPALMIPFTDIDDKSTDFKPQTYHEVWPVELWADQFT